MKKRGSIITVVSLKTYLIIGAICVLIVLGIWFFILKSNGMVKLPSSCPQGIIPDRIPESILNSYMPGEAPTFNWSDGEKISFPYVGGSAAFSCFKGSKEGENANYFYCKGWEYNKRAPVSETGIIGKEINLKIDVVLDSKNKTEEGYKVVSYKCSG
ncbi:MAG: hypothetical protein WC796_02165 [Candidatus Pacearchaeota archaeon]|jgi:hypothetical protein